MDRTILHCDCNGFYASVECLLYPQLKKVPMAVCGDPESRRGIILAKNELAKKYQIKTAETIWQAKRKCPQLTLVPPHREEYARYSRLINQIYQRYTDLVEPFGIDESWLDVTGSQRLFGDGKEIADRLRREIRTELGLTISAGVSFNKIFAKLGSDYKKPDATTVISRENFKEMVFPLSVSDLLYVGDTAAHTLHRLSIHTIGDLAMADKAVLTRCLGKLGGELHDYANGLDSSPVRSVYDKQDAKSIGNSITFRRNLTGRKDILAGVIALSDTVAARMRKNGVKCSTIQVVIRSPSFHNISRQTTLPSPTFLAKELAETAMQLIESSWKMENPIRMLSITGCHFVNAEDAEEQLNFFEPDKPLHRERQEHLETAVDHIRGKFGPDAVSFGSLVNNDIGIRTTPKKENKQNGTS